MDIAVQYIETPSGRLAILPEADFEALRDAAEMARDTAAYDRARQRLDAGEDEVVPFETTTRLLAGENPIRVWREFRGLSASRLAEAAGISAGYLSQIETGQREGTLSTLRAVARVLSVSLDDLAPPVQPE